MTDVPEVQAASNQTLVTTFAALTHAIHDAGKTTNPRFTLVDTDKEREFRKQRDEVEAEILRRMEKS